jgi:hypothetical protein
MSKTEYVRFEVCDFHGISRSKLVPARNKDSKVFLYAGELTSSSARQFVNCVMMLLSVYTLIHEACDAMPAARRLYCIHRHAGARGMLYSDGEVPRYHAL